MHAAAETSEEEEQVIDRLLVELGIRLPAVEMVDNEDLSESIALQDPDQSMRLDELREWRLVPFS